MFFKLTEFEIKSRITEQTKVANTLNPFMHNVVKSQTYFKNLAVFTKTPQDFKSMFGYFTTFYMKG